MRTIATDTPNPAAVPPAASPASILPAVALGTISAGLPAATAAAAVAPVTPEQAAGILVNHLAGLLAELEAWQAQPDPAAYFSALEVLDASADDELPALAGQVRTWEQAALIGSALFGPGVVPPAVLADPEGDAEGEGVGASLFDLFRAAGVVADHRNHGSGAAVYLLRALALAAHQRYGGALDNATAREEGQPA